jgi:DNA polymerase III sliding clamp (beta) subunit (PCNA family)
MEFSVDTSTFADALEQIQGAVAKKSMILSHALVRLQRPACGWPPPI